MEINAAGNQQAPPQLLTAFRGGNGLAIYWTIDFQLHFRRSESLANERLRSAFEVHCACRRPLSWEFKLFRRGVTPFIGWGSNAKARLIPRASYVCRARGSV